MSRKALQFRPAGRTGTLAAINELVDHNRAQRLGFAQTGVALGWY
jgi:hypothetical protein